MKTFFKPANILFYFLSTLVFFFLGMALASIAGAGKGQGLAAGAIVFGYGALSGGLAFIISLFAVWFLHEKYVGLLNKILAVILFLFMAFFVYRYQARHAALDETNKTKFAGVFPLTVAAGFQMNNESQYRPPIGLGMATPKFYENSVLYFYGNPNLEKPLSDHSPTDSLVFKRTEIGMEITYAPPWFTPAHLKMDYNMLFIRVVSLHSEFIEVMINETNGQTTYMDRYMNQLRFWPEFLLTINSVEPLNRQDNPPRVKPLSHASLVISEYSFLRPLRITDQWLHVELLNDSFKSQGKGWIKWQENGNLLITYSLLS